MAQAHSGASPAVASHGLSEADTARIRAALEHHSFFLGEREALEDRAAFGAFLNCFRRVSFPAGTVIIRQGDAGRDFYVLEEGHCDVLVTKFDKPVKVNDVTPGMPFGELAFVYKRPRAATIVATKPCVAWVADEQCLEAFVRASPAIRHRIDSHAWLRNVMSEHVLFSHLDSEAKREALVRAFVEEELPAGVVLTHQGETSDGRFFVVADGECEVYVQKAGEPEVLVARLHVGDSFGELSLLYDQPRTATVRTSRPSVLMSLDRGMFKSLSARGSHCYQDVFQRFASVHRGTDTYMTLDDFLTALRTARAESGDASSSSHTPVAAQKLALMFKVADKTGSNLISFSEFVLLCMLLEKPHPEFEIAFRFFDKDKSGSIDREEFVTAMTAIMASEGIRSHKGSPVTPLDERLLTELFGRDGSAKLSYEEFEQLLKQGRLPELVEFWRNLADNVRIARESWLKRVTTVTSEDGMVVSAQDAPNGIDSYKYLIAGGVAGAASRTFVAPLVRLKMLLQTQAEPKKYTGVVQGIRLMYREDGLRGFFRGNGSNVMRIIPMTGLQYYFYEHLKGIMRDDDGHLTILRRLLAGGLAGVTASTATYPLDMIRARLTVQSGPHRQYRGIFHGMRVVVSSEGPVALYKGLWPTMLGVFPFMAIDFAVYEGLKPYAPRREGTEEATTLGLLLCGACAGLVSQTIAFPLETVRRRLQVQDIVGKYRYRGVWDGLRSTFRCEGLLGLYRGLWPNYLKAAPSIAIAFVVYEHAKRLMGLPS